MVDDTLMNEILCHDEVKIHDEMILVLHQIVDDEDIHFPLLYLLVLQALLLIHRTLIRPILPQYELILSGMDLMIIDHDLEVCQSPHWVDAFYAKFLLHEDYS